MECSARGSQGGRALSYIDFFAKRDDVAFNFRAALDFRCLDFFANIFLKLDSEVVEIILDPAAHAKWPAEFDRGLIFINFNNFRNSFRAPVLVELLDGSLDMSPRFHFLKKYFSMAP